MAQCHVASKWQIWVRHESRQPGPRVCAPNSTPNGSSKGVSQRSVCFSRGAPMPPKGPPSVLRNLWEIPCAALPHTPWSPRLERLGGSFTTTLPWQVRKGKRAGTSPQVHCQCGHENHSVPAELSTLAAMLGQPVQDLRVKNCLPYWGLFNPRSFRGEREPGMTGGGGLPRGCPCAVVGGTHSRWCRWGSPHQAPQPDSLQPELTFGWRPLHRTHWTEDEGGGPGQ